MNFEISSSNFDKISVDSLIVFAFQGEKDKKDLYTSLSAFQTVDSLLNGQLASVAAADRFRGKKGEVLTLHPGITIAPTRIVVLGLGEKDGFVADDMRKAIGSYVMRMKKKIDSLAVILPTDDEVTVTHTDMAQIVTEGILLANYEFAKYKAKEKGERAFDTVIFVEQKETVKKEVKEGVTRGKLFAQATALTRDLVNEQPAVATPTYLADLAKDIAKANPQISCKIFDLPELEKMGMGAFLGIAKAAAKEIPPKFIHLEYTPKKATSKGKLAIIGKGITFDSGGINVKPGDHMEDMKMDMAGAALVLGVFSVISEIHPDFPVMGLIAATPNLISATSLVPGDVVKAYNGKTIEVLNTDAEGRVTMADSLSYGVKQGATRLLDFATLTGACMVALGPDISGMFSNNRDLADEIKAAAFTAGEKVWELPLEKEYKAMNKSEVADIANIPNSRYGGALTAALFLEEFVSDKPWAHFDIAGPAFSNRMTDIGPKGGTGHGVRMVLHMLSK